MLCTIILAFESMTAGGIWFSEASLWLKIALTVLLVVNFCTFTGFVFADRYSISGILCHIGCYLSFAAVIAGCWVGGAWAGLFPYVFLLVLVLIFDIGRNWPVKQDTSTKSS